MARQARVPGTTKYVNETRTAQTRIPGGLAGPYMNETAAAVQLKRWTGAAWVAAKLYVFVGGSWVVKPLKRWTGAAWTTVTCKP